MREPDNLTTFMCRKSGKSGSLNLLEPSGPHRACYGNRFPFYSHFCLFGSNDILKMLVSKCCLCKNCLFKYTRGADKSLARPGRKQALPCRKKKTLMTARVSMLLKSRASPDMLPFSLCNKKRLAIRHMNRPLFPTTLSIPSYDIGK